MVFLGNVSGLIIILRFVARLCEFYDSVLRKRVETGRLTDEDGRKFECVYLLQDTSTTIPSPRSGYQSRQAAAI